MRSSDFFGLGQRSTKSIVNFYSSGDVSTTMPVGAAVAREVLSGPLTAGTLATVLSVTGVGRVQHLCAYSKDGTARTIRLVVIVDGQSVPCFDATTNSFSATSQGLSAVSYAAQAEIVFNNSLQVLVASSNTETDMVAIGYMLETKQ